MEHKQKEDLQSPKAKEGANNQQIVSNLEFLKNEPRSLQQLQYRFEEPASSQVQSKSIKSVNLSPRISESGIVADLAYDADVDEDIIAVDRNVVDIDMAMATATKAENLQQEREHIYELFQPWALRTYGDQAKTKTITLRKKARILKALEGKEHSRPDSSKFRFWVKSKAFTTKRPADFEEIPGSQRRCDPPPPFTSPSDNPKDVDLFVGSTTKDLSKRTFRKVAVVEEFFDIIYNVHMELGGRSGMHAGQKRTYRIITESYAFLPREAVTRFLSICPECKKNLRATSPAPPRQTEEQANDSSSEIEALNYSSHTESSVEAAPTENKPSIVKRRCLSQDSSLHRTQSTKVFNVDQTHTTCTTKSSVQQRPYSNPTQCAMVSAMMSQAALKCSLNQDLLKRPQSNAPKTLSSSFLQRPLTPPLSSFRSECVPPDTIPFSLNSSHPFEEDPFKTQQSLLRYYDLMRRFYAGGFAPQSLEKQSQNLLMPTYCEGNKVKADANTGWLISAELPKCSLTKPSQKYTQSTISRSSDCEPLCTEPNAKKFKSWTRDYSLQTTETSEESQHSTSKLNELKEINFFSPFLFRSNGTPRSSLMSLNSQKRPKPDQDDPELSLSAIPSTSTSTTRISQPIPKNPEEPTSQKKQQAPGLRIPQPRPARPLTLPLPPLDLEQLKPITTTYLQLTRSMKISDEEALRFDNLLCMSPHPTAPYC